MINPKGSILPSLVHLMFFTMLYSKMPHALIRHDHIHYAPMCVCVCVCVCVCARPLNYIYCSIHPLPMMFKKMTFIILQNSYMEPTLIGSNTAEGRNLAQHERVCTALSAVHYAKQIGSI